jgi:hypothetical protein
MLVVLRIEPWVIKRSDNCVETDPCLVDTFLLGETSYASVFESGKRRGKQCRDDFSI